MGVFWLWGFGISESLHSVARLGQWLATSWCPALSLDCLTCVGRWLSLRPVGTTWTNCHNSRSTAGTDFIVIVIEPICTETPHRSELLLQLKVLKPVARNGLYFELVDYMTIWLHDYMTPWLHESCFSVKRFAVCSFGCGTNWPKFEATWIEHAEETLQSDDVLTMKLHM